MTDRANPQPPMKPLGFDLHILQHSLCKLSIVPGPASPRHGLSRRRELCSNALKKLDVSCAGSVVGSKAQISQCHRSRRVHDASGSGAGTPCFPGIPSACGKLYAGYCRRGFSFRTNFHRLGAAERRPLSIFRTRREATSSDQIVSSYRKPFFVESGDHDAIASKVANEASANLVLVAPKLEAWVRRPWSAPYQC
jgi:hypothetical protein